MSDKKSPTLWQVLKSVLAAMFGVQSDAVRKRDFETGKAWQFIVVGIILVTLFVLMIVGLVQIVLRTVVP